MSFTRTRPPGFWTFNSVVAPSEFEHIDDYSYAIDGLGGGTYAPTALITIGGSGLNVTGPMDATDVGTMDVYTTFSIRGGATMQMFGTQIVSGTLSIISGAFITVGNGGTFTINAGATATVAAAITLSGATTISGALTCSNTIALSGVTTQTGTFTKSGTGAISAERVQATNPALAIETISTDADTWYVATIVPGGASVYTVKSSSPTPSVGARVSLNAYNTGIGKSIEVKREDASLIATLTTGDGGVTLVFWDGGWKLVGAWGQVTLGSVYS
jgi:hypothetical protein